VGSSISSPLVTQDEATGDLAFAGGDRWAAASNGVFDGAWHDLAISKRPGAGGNAAFAVDGSNVGTVRVPSVTPVGSSSALRIFAGWPMVFDPEVVFSYGGQAPAGVEPDDAPVLSASLRSNGRAGFEAAVDLGWSVDRVLVAVTRDLVAFPGDIDWSAGNVSGTPRAIAVRTRSVGIPVAGPGVHFAYVAGKNSDARGAEVSPPVLVGPLVTEGIDAALLPAVGPVKYLGSAGGGFSTPAGPVIDDPTAFAYLEEPGLCNAGRTFPGGVMYTRVSVGLGGEASAGGLSALAGSVRSSAGNTGRALLTQGFSATDVSALPTRFALAAGSETEAVLSNLQPGGGYELYSFGASLEAGAGAGLTEVPGVIDRRLLRPPATFASASNVRLVQAVPPPGATTAGSTLAARLDQVVPSVPGDPGEPSASGVLQSFRAALVTVASGVDLGPDPVGRLAQLRDRFRGAGSVSDISR
jgi:hypothetical protein